jgi:hypothetical protein
MAGRTVHHGDGLAWLRSAALTADHAIVTSLPDVSELSLSLEKWKSWFVDAASLACSVADERAVVVFFQTDIKRGGGWIDKGFLVNVGAERAGSRLLWHKIVCRAPAGTTTFGRPAYAHLQCFSRKLELSPGEAFADVLPSLGQMTWARAMGVEACRAACRFIVSSTPCRTVVDPFCGMGTMLAVANAYGLEAVGVETSKKRAARARELVLPE